MLWKAIRVPSGEKDGCESLLPTVALPGLLLTFVRSVPSALIVKTSKLAGLPPAAGLERWKTILLPPGDQPPTKESRLVGVPRPVSWTSFVPLAFIFQTLLFLTNAICVPSAENRGLKSLVVLSCSRTCDVGAPVAGSMDPLSFIVKISRKEPPAGGGFGPSGPEQAINPLVPGNAAWAVAPGPALSAASHRATSAASARRARPALRRCPSSRPWTMAT